ncbi:hypothetical protein [Anabaena catenula]|uniref:DUF642 domain-containing protein n=1 Tax=Anabaena catenula FACHB-362 TaxID=2692877 RepID=A0ABR8J8L1_9NOST|nr:hypothetical protein [Anabaena catenula]MBD2693341.1 hypothetical protein [Anabaena catenula FACHB-362]
MKKQLLTVTLTATIFGSLTNPSQALEFVNNGSFENGFTGWTVLSQTGSMGNVSITSGGTSPISSSTIPLPTQGTRYAVTDQNGLGSYVLYQDITLSSGSTYSLSFNYFAQTAAPLYVGSNMSLNTIQNQHARVDIMTPFSAGFDPFNSAPNTNVLANVLAPTASPSNFTSVTGYNLTPFAGQTIRLAFRQVDNQTYFQFGIDNVSIQSAAAPVPFGLNTETSLAVGLPLFLGLRLLKKKVISKNKQSKAIDILA